MKYARVENDRGRKDQPHNVTRAKVDLRNLRTIAGMTITGCAAIYNLSEKQAETLLLAEADRRERERPDDAKQVVREAGRGR